jgi:hypothetical protein
VLFIHWYLRPACDDVDATHPVHELLERAQAVAKQLEIVARAIGIQVIARNGGVSMK